MNEKIIIGGVLIAAAIWYLKNQSDQAESETVSIQPHCFAPPCDPMNGLKKLYEVHFNNSEKNFDRVAATSKTEAERIMKKMYPEDKVTRVVLL